jgi:hypothetical protein
MVGDLGTLSKFFFEITFLSPPSVADLKLSNKKKYFSSEKKKFSRGCNFCPKLAPVVSDKNNYSKIRFLSPPSVAVLKL